MNATTPTPTTAAPDPVKVFQRLLTTAKLLYANSEGCAVNHYGEDFSLHGLPGWLADCAADIVAAEALGARAMQSAMSAHAGGGEADFWAVHSKSGMHIGLWPDKADADEALREYEGSTAMPLYTHPTPTEVKAAPAEAVKVKDWLRAAKLAGEHGIRYQTNKALERFLSEARSALDLATPQEGLKTALHEACLNSAREMGDYIKSMSWFGRNVEPTPAPAASDGLVERLRGPLPTKPAIDGHGQALDLGEVERRMEDAAVEMERLGARLSSSSDYSIDLQRIIEDLCKGREIRPPKTSARHHYDMAVEARAALGKQEGV